ncbi:hypothetical protein [Massilia glaciei]|uniref:hypothetical protein n=1 Tax=Massilia glaciei TaxID=1524097 RepID=UPI0011B2815E|nr:hypothetical protein [Massilia glaciei]
MMPLHDERVLEKLINEGLRPHEVRLEGRHVALLAAGWPQWVARRDNPASLQAELLGAHYLQSRIAALSEEIGRLREGQGNFTKRYAVASDNADRRRVILDYARELGAGRAQLRGDRRAFSRWFGPDAMQDRVRIRISKAERLLSFCLQSLGRLAARFLGAAPEQTAAWATLGLEGTLLPLLAWDGDPRVRTESFRALAVALQTLPPALAPHAIGDATTAYVYRAALDRRLDVWIQREALLLLLNVAPERFALVVAQRLDDRSEGDDLFVRRYAVELVGAACHLDPDLERLFGAAADDPSAFVRQGLANTLTNAADHTTRQLWPRLGLDDAVVQVRAAALLQLPRIGLRPTLFGDALGWLAQALRREGTGFGLRVALQAAEDGAAALDGDARRQWIASLLPLIEQLHVDSPLLMVRRWCAETRERIRLRGDAGALALAQRLAPVIRGCAPGAAGGRDAALGDADADAERAGRVLACLAQRDHGLGLERAGRRWRLWRGHRFGFRLWRLLHEWRHPSPDKRQAFNHTIGRVFRGTLRAPSAILGELAQTKVPGEPLHMASEAGWRPYLPLVDDLISLLDESASEGPLRLYTAEGVTEVGAPDGIVKRLAARTTLTTRFEQFANARNWSEASAAHPASYLRMLSELGFELRFRPYPDTLPDPAVTRFFPAMAALPLPELPNRIENYFFSAYENTLFDLSLFVGLSIAAFIGHHVWVNHRMRRARNSIPLVVGGWGTRGKSGTERLKAAMFNAQGYSIMSKTTGCEAMFVYAPPHGELREMFLFRPYDKATIWEQYNVVRLASELECEVFLWECMALTPSFVHLLQRSWMRDDYSTLTNTFPDHEDLQGPAGIDIPQVMTQFIPKRRVLLTTEEQMRPILQSAADALGTQLKGVGWLESGLIAPDILARFPYQEHPDNIALVAALGAELGVGYDFALKAMADKVVLDLGVLKTFAPVSVGMRTLEFSNGMSANERYGCLGNWRRLGFDRQDPVAEPGVMISTVVNNRADRIARSRVFAGVLVQEIRADFHVLIGSNLDGLRGYLRETWGTHAQSLTLWPQQNNEGGPPAMLAAAARDYRIVHSDAQVAARLRVMLEGIGAPARLAHEAGGHDALARALAALGLAHAGEVLAFHARDVATLREYAALEQRCLQAGAAPDAALDQAFRDQMWQWFERRIVVVGDYHASGDAVIAAIRDATPPGFHNRIMGLQNIKGTGLDFVYRWLAWDACHRACTDLMARDPILKRRGLAALSDFQEYGLLSEELVQATLAQLPDTPFGQQERVRVELAAIAKKLGAKMQQVRAGISVTRSAGWKEKIFDAIEGFLDAGDAVRRRRRADRIYKDLVARRISEARAVVELQLLTQRQKGGWFSKSVDQTLRRFERRPRAGAAASKAGAGG